MTRLWIKDFLRLITFITFSVSFFLHPVTSFHSHHLQRHYYQRYLLQATDLNSPMPSSTSTSNQSSCSEITCSQHGQCTNEDQCICDNGYAGMDCQQDLTSKSQCKNGQLDKNGQCCESGIFDYKDNKCCLNNAKVTLDKDGQCCNSGILDRCGICDGHGYVDVLGKCCQTILDASGLCCHSGHLDVCGICDGTGDSCKTLLHLELDHKIKNTDYSCLNSWLSSLLPKDVKIAIVKVSSVPPILYVDITDAYVSVAMVQYEIERKDANPCGVEKMHSHEKKSICNNGFCELGEEERCPQDCFYGLETCDVDADGLQCSGRGICAGSLDRGVCSCFVGYEGENCERCSEGFYVYNGLCLKRQHLNTTTINQIVIIEDKENNKQENLTSITVQVKEENKGGNKAEKLVMSFILAISIMVSLLVVSFVVYQCKISRQNINDLASETGTDQGHYNDSGDSVEESNLSSNMRDTDIRRLRNEILDKDILKSKSLRNLLHNYLQTWIDEQKNPPWMADLYSTASTS